MRAPPPPRADTAIGTALTVLPGPGREHPWLGQWKPCPPTLCSAHGACGEGGRAGRGSATETRGRSRTRNRRQGRTDGSSRRKQLTGEGTSRGGNRAPGREATGGPGQRLRPAWGTQAGHGYRAAGRGRPGAGGRGGPAPSQTENNHTTHAVRPMHLLPGGPVGLSLRAFKCFHTHTKGRERKF